MAGAAMGTRPVEGGEGRRGRRRAWRWIEALIGLQMLALAVFGTLTVARFPLWAPIDEAAHYSYVQEIADHGRLPVLGQTRISESIMAIQLHADPAHFHVDPSTLGPAGEAFQPPLYYLLAAPVYAAVPGYLDKAYALRAFDLVLLVGSALLALQLCRYLLPRHWRMVAPLVLSVFLIPGVVVRSITVSNQALELPVALAFTLAFCWAWNRPSSTRRVVVLGAALGAALLTQLLLAALAPLLLVAVWRWWRHRDRTVDPAHGWAAVVGLLAVPAVLVAPWLVFNQIHYHAFTADALAVKLQTPLVNPRHLRYHLASLPHDTVDGLWQILLPQEWSAALVAHARPVISWAGRAVGVALIPLAAVAMVAGGRRFWRSPATWLAVPYLTVTGMLWWITYGTQWNVMLGRYTYAELPAWVLAGACALGSVAGRRAVTLAGSTVAVVMIGCWCYLAAVFLAL